MRAILPAIGTILMFMTVYLTFVTPPIPPGRFIETVKPWPPGLGEVFPDLELIDQDGKAFKFSDLKGKVVLLQFVAMNNPACQTLSGSEKIGPLGNAAVLEGLEPISATFPKHTKGLKFPNPDVVFIQILLYNMGYQKPSLRDAELWSKHFGLKTSNNQIIAVSPHDLRSDKTRTLIPGFQLIDKNLIIQADSTGSRPQDDLFKRLLPLVPIALDTKKR